MSPKAKENEPEFVRVLVFMDVSAPDLVDAAAAAKSSVATALHELPELPARLFVRVLVHGYQVEARSQLGSECTAYDRPPHGLAPQLVSTTRLASSVAYTPADPAALAAFVEQSQRERPPQFEGGESRTTLFVWGHGQGVGSRLGRAVDIRPAREGRLPPQVEPPSLLNAGAAAGRNAVAALKAALLKGEARRPPLDLLVFDSCLMASAEVAFECRGLARFVIASQSFVARPGMELGGSIAEYLTVYHQHQGAARAAAKALVNRAGSLRSGAHEITLIQPTPDPPSEQPRQASPNALSIAAGLARWAENLSREASRPASPDLGYEAPQAWPAAIAGVAELAPLFKQQPWFALAWAFTHLLRWASADADECPRLLAAFERTRYTKVRQFLDLKDLARQVHLHSRLAPLQLVALELMRELEERDDGFVVRWRVFEGHEEKQRHGGVSIYCPWFEATGPDEFDASVDHEVYRQLELPRRTSWAGFMLGPLGARLSGRQERLRQAEQAAFAAEARWIRVLREALCGDDACSDAGRPGGPIGRLVKGSGPQAREDDLGGPVKGSGPQAQTD